ncbi:MAG: hypothetical protein JWO91_3788 [Acidobacteriaceae bacterium]|nr:hypothetical protein [Acidobacteriaceae bacterium]
MCQAQPIGGFCIVRKYRSKSGSLGPGSFLFLQFFFIRCDFDSFVFYIETQPVVDAHILVRDPDQRKKRDQIASPIVI